MRCRPSWLVWLGCVLLSAAIATAQEPKRADSPGVQKRAEAQKGDSAERWQLGDQQWDFKDIAAVYEAVKGHVESRSGSGELAVWKLKLKKDLEEGAQRLQEELRGSPFKIVLLDGERTTINPDLPASITPVPARKDDTIELYVALPNSDVLRDVKHIRIQRRTDIGF